MRGLLNRFGLSTALTGLLLAAGCSTYVEDFDYVPHPAVAEITPVPPDRAPPVSAFATVVGLRRADHDQDIPTSIQVRLRLENNGPRDLHIDPQSLKLETGDLLAFSPPIVRPGRLVTVSPQDSVTFDAFFPFPPDHSYHNTDLRALNLRWRVEIAESSFVESVSFQRVDPYRDYAYPDPYWGYPGYGYWRGGVIIERGRRWR